MRSEWPRKHLAEISEVITGFPFKGEKYLPPKHGVRVVRGDNVTERYLRWGEKEKCWSGVTADLKPYVLRSGDVVIGMDGSKVGKNFAAISPDDEGSLLAQRVARLRAREGISQDYLRYVICNDSFTEYVKAVHTGTSIPHISKGQIENFEVVVPPFEDQQQIAAVLISLDDRITLLRETNATLEAIAQALFKSWFVDFDPVRAKMEGRTPEGMDEATAALFPDGFETSELGEVPRGWRVGKLGDVAALKGGKQLSKEAFSNSAPNPVFGGAGVMGHTAQRNATDFVITVGRVGAYCGQFFWHIGNAWVNNNASHVVPSRKISSEWLLLWLKSVNMDVIKKGAAQPFVSNGDIAKLSMIHPPIELIDAFGALVAPMFARSQLLVQQSVELASVRDTLLPRLISGQLRLSEAQAATEAALGGTLSV